MKVFLVDDHGERGEYAHFLEAYAGGCLPELSLSVFSYAESLFDALKLDTPQIIMLDMRFDDTPTIQLCGDIQGLAQTERFCGDTTRAEAQVRSSQGLFILRELRSRQIQTPVVLFATLTETQKERLARQCAPLRVVDGLILQDIQDVLTWAQNI